MGRAVNSIPRTQDSLIHSRLPAGRIFPALPQLFDPPDESTALAADGSDLGTSAAKSLEGFVHPMGASVFVSGSFAKGRQGIGVTLIATVAEERPQHIADLTGRIPV